MPLAPVPATPHQLRVWRAMRAIPPGRPLTYGQLAALLGSSPRAVGNAAAANPWPLLVPCHRVVGRGGAGGYLGEAEGAGPRIKRWLLEREGWRADGG
ncbi:MAG: methylated-DNA--[protein]-cysteine S-methyltransferase [Thiohalospira sp.]